MLYKIIDNNLVAIQKNKVSLNRNKSGIWNTLEFVFQNCIKY